MPTEADNEVNHEKADKSNEQPTSKSVARRRKRMRARGSQTDDEALSNGEQHNVHVHGFRICNTKLNERQAELDKLLSVLPEIQNFKY